MNVSYKKRAGTSGISGDLYKIKLTSLILFKLLHDDSIEDFYLATNMDEIGPFGDICFKAKIQGSNHPVFVFMHVKHKDDKDTSLKFDVVKDFYESFANVNKKFNTKKDVFYSQKCRDTQCFFILYTNAKYFDQLPNLQSINSQGDTNSIPKCIINDKLNEIMCTGDDASEQRGSGVDYTEEDLEFVKGKIVDEEITMLAEHFVKYLNGREDPIHMYSDEYIMKYHRFLAANVVDISDIKTYTETSPQEQLWRELTFRSDFFKSDDKILTMLRNKIIELIVETINVEEKILNDDPSVTTAPIAEGNNNYYKLGTINETLTEAVKNRLLSLTLNVPVNFGHVDISIQCTEAAMEEYLEGISQFFVKLCETCTFIDPFYIVTINDPLVEFIFDQFSSLLVYDAASKFLMVTENFTSLRDKAKGLYNRLKCKMPDLHLYRFATKQIYLFPKLNFDCTKEAAAILNKVKIYEKQCNIKGLDDILGNAINHPSINYAKQNLPIDIESAIIHYHNKIQDWWMSPKTGAYLSKSSNIYELAVKSIIKEPQTSALLTTFYMNTIKYNAYQFSETAVESLKLIQMYSRTIVETKLVLLTTIKAMQCLRNIYNINYTVLNMDYVLNLPQNDLTALILELNESDKVLIIVFDFTNDYISLHRILNLIAKAIKEKNLIVITDTKFAKTAHDYFSCRGIIYDNCQSLIDLTPESRNHILKTTEVIFQGVEKKLDLIVNDESTAHIKNIMLDKIISNEILIIGKTLSDQKYEEIKHVYINRKLYHKTDPLLLNGEQNNLENDCKINTYIPVNTLHDVPGNTVLLTAGPGMGKSTLLTHLSLETKKDSKLWIVRINLLEYAKILFYWHKHNTAINTLKSLEFIMSNVILRNNTLPINLKENNNKVYIDAYKGDDWTNFELHLFLHYYNESNLLLLIDGLDEVCPYYKTTVLKFLNAVNNYPQQQKIWVTSRNSNEILPDLHKICDESYEIKCISGEEQKLYLYKYWQGKLVIDKLNNIQLKNIISFLDFINTNNNRIFQSIVHVFYEYIQRHFPQINTRPNDLPITDDELVKQRDDIIMSSPELLRLYADYFVNLICIGENWNNWESNIQFSTLAVYEKYIKVLLEDNNNTNFYKPDMMRRLEKERADILSKHKKLGAYVHLFHITYLDDLKTACPFYQENEYKAIINDIKCGTMKTGLISHISEDNIPVFIYKAIGEYFAAEFFCDIFKSKQYDFSNFHSKYILYAVVKVISYDILIWIDRKRLVDSELDGILRDIELRRPQILDGYANIFAMDWSQEHVIRIKSSYLEDYESDCTVKYNDEYITTLLLDPEDQKTRIKELQDSIISKMKPHLKKYFVTIPTDD